MRAGVAASPRQVLAVVLLGTGTVSLANSMLNPALPAFMHAFDLSAGQAGQVLSWFMVAMVLSMPLTGYLGARHGRRRVYLSGMALFALGSLLGALAQDFVQVLAARVLQGLASGLVIPLSLPLLFSVFPVEQRGRVTGAWAGIVMLIPAVGPLCGAVLFEHLHWRALFVLPVVVAGLAWGLARRWLAVSELLGPRPDFDAAGFALIALSLSLFMAAGHGLAQGASLLASSSLFAAVVTLIGFVRVERRLERDQAAPLLNLGMFARRDFRHGVIISVMQSISMFSNLVLVPLWVQVVMGKSALWTGWMLLATAVCASLGGRLAGHWVDRYGPRYLIGGGLVITLMASLGLGQLTAGASMGLLGALMALRGLGVGLSYMPATTVALNTLPETLTTQGAAVNNVARRVMASLAVVGVSLAVDALPAQGVSLETTLASLFTVTGLALVVALPSAACLNPKPLRDSAPSRV